MFFRAKSMPMKTKAKYKVTKKLLNELAERRVFTTVNKNEKSWLQLGKVVTFDHQVFVEPYSAIRAGNKFCSIGAFSYTRSSFPCSVEIGRYCAIGTGVEVMGVDHPMERLSMGGFDYSKRSIFEAAREDFNSAQKITPLPTRKLKGQQIGHDVWIGNDALIGRGVKIGNGAVIATRSIVTKDVPDYAIVAGSPARVKRLRFPEKLVERLLTSKWWEYNFTSFDKLDTTRPEIFLDQFEELVQAGKLKPWEPNKIDLNQLFADFAERKI